MADGTVTALLSAWRAGDHTAADKLMPLVYEELHRLAQHHLRAERSDHTFRPTELISEAYLRLVDGQPEWEDRKHFYGIAARVMRQILVDHARKRVAGKRGAGDKPLPLDEGLAVVARPAELLALDEALGELARFDERKARAVELYFFGGLTQDEIARTLEVHVNTVAHDLRLAAAWMHTQIAGS